MASRHVSLGLESPQVRAIGRGFGVERPAAWIRMHASTAHGPHARPPRLAAPAAAGAVAGGLQLRVDLADAAVGSSTLIHLAREPEPRHLIPHRAPWGLGATRTHSTAPPRTTSPQAAGRQAPELRPSALFCGALLPDRFSPPRGSQIGSIEASPTQGVGLGRRAARIARIDAHRETWSTPADRPRRPGLV